MSHPDVTENAVETRRGLIANRDLMAEHLINFVVEERHLRRGLAALDAIDGAIAAAERHLDELDPDWWIEDDDQ